MGKVMKKPPKDVDAYIARAPKEVQDKLKEVRAAIREAAPTALESKVTECLTIATKGGWHGSAFTKGILDSIYGLLS
jgi:hypothetical protein